MPDMAIECAMKILALHESAHSAAHGNGARLVGPAAALVGSAPERGAGPRAGGCAHGGGTEGTCEPRRRASEQLTRQAGVGRSLVAIATSY